MLQRYLQYRAIVGTSSVTQIAPSLDLSFILKKFKNYSTDEYSTMDNNGMSVPPLACAFAKMGQHQHVVGIVDEDGYLVLYNIHKTGRAAVIKTWQVHANAVFDMEWLQESNQLLTGSGDQRIILHDVETCEKLEIFKGHASSVKSISCRPDDDAVFVSGSRDGHIMIWDKRVNPKDGTIAPVTRILNAHTMKLNSLTPKSRKKATNSVMDVQQSVTSVLFQNSNNVISAGAVDGCLKVWDVRKSSRISGAQPVHTFPYPGKNLRKRGYSSLVQDSRGLRLFASCTDDVIYQYDVASYNPVPVCTWSGHKNTTFYVKSTVSPDDQYLLSGSSDEMAYIWQISKPEAAPVVLKSHTAEVTSVAWCPSDWTKLVTLSDDSKTKFWRIYCRELSRKFHPECLGHAEKTSIKGAVVNKSQILGQSPANLRPEQKSEATIPKLSKTKSVSSPTPCIYDWFKRRSNSQGSEELVRKVSRQESAPPSSDNKKPSACPVTAPGNVSTDEVSSGESERLSSPVSTDSSQSKKRSRDESEISSDSSHCPMDPCMRCKGIESCTSELVSSVKRQKIGNLNTTNDSNNKIKDTCLEIFDTQKTEYSTTMCSPTKTAKNPMSSPHKRSPGKRNENHSPKKLVGHRVNSEMDEYVISPKRPRLMQLDSNGNSTPGFSVRISLFSDKPSTKLNPTSGNSDCTSHPSAVSSKLLSSLEDCCMKAESNSSIEYESDPSTCGQSRLKPSKNCEEAGDCADNLESPYKDDHSRRLADGIDLNSPTRDLPNLVLDELYGRNVTTPSSKSKAHSPKVDWLTQLRIQKSQKDFDKSPKQTPGKLTMKVVKGLRKK